VFSKYSNHYSNQTSSKIDGVHYSEVEKNLGIGSLGGAYAKFDDGNSAWLTDEDIPEEDAETEARWRADDAASGYRPGKITGDLKKQQKAIIVAELYVRFNWLLLILP
jgi:hypothetical protein